ncbi:MAG: OsmC family protein [Psychroserpens sp.]|uniref:OsmC family protein n=1 Tax=Psychroserpens sp. TaxID=2020870 RepID=UPI003C714E2A
MTSKATYLGKLRTESVHLKSNASFLTDAPVDNKGKGEAFSPTDTIATGLASCILTIMGIKAEEMNLDITGTAAHVTKTMASGPRRISKIDIVFDLPFEADEKTRTILERAAVTCPVYYSLNTDIEKNLQFNWK